MLEDYLKGEYIRGVVKRTGEETVVVMLRLTHAEAVSVIESASHTGVTAKQFACDAIMDAAYTTDPERLARREAACDRMGITRDVRPEA